MKRITGLIIFVVLMTITLSYAFTDWHLAATLMDWLEVICIGVVAWIAGKMSFDG